MTCSSNRFNEATNQIERIQIRLYKVPPTAKGRQSLRVLKHLCWGILPAAIVAVLILDGLGIYSFNTERLIVLGAVLIVVLLPFFSEITVKNISIKRNGDDD